MENRDQQEEKIISSLRSLHALAPSRRFTDLSRRLILLSDQNENYLNRFRRGISALVAMRQRLAIAVLAVVLALGGMLYVREYTRLVAEQKNQERLLSEARSLDFQIELQEARYFEESLNAASVAIKGVFENGK